MAVLNRRVAVKTVGLGSPIQSQLDRQLAEFPEIDLEHLDGWAFRLLQADVLVLNLEQEQGQEARDMLKSFGGGGRAPLEVTYSESEERMHMWDGVHPVSGRMLGRQSAPRFSRRLQQALRRAGCSEVVLEDLATDSRVVAGDGAKQRVETGIRWTG